jgi:cell wall-associated NlpC family hydrolase
VLYLYNAIDKQDVQKAVKDGKSNRDGDGQAKTIEPDATIIAQFLGYNEEKQDADPDIQPGDIVFFGSKQSDSHDASCAGRRVQSGFVVEHPSAGIWQDGVGGAKQAPHDGVV